MACIRPWHPEHYHQRQEREYRPRGRGTRNWLAEYHRKHAHTLRTTARIAATGLIWFGVLVLIYSHDDTGRRNASGCRPSPADVMRRPRALSIMQTTTAIETCASHHQT